MDTISLNLNYSEWNLRNVCFKIDAEALIDIAIAKKPFHRILNERTYGIIVL